MDKFSPGPMSSRPLNMTNNARCDVCGKGRGFNSKVSHVKCSAIRKARGFGWVHEQHIAKVNAMSNVEEAREATGVAEAIVRATPGITGAAIAQRLNEAFEGLYYVVEEVVYLQNEPDYLKPHMVIRLW